MASEIRNTSRGIVIYKDQMLLMERWRDGMHYFSVPGGGIEKDEAPEETVVRELLEETTVKVTLARKLYEMTEGSNTHHIYMCEYVNGEPRLPENSPEYIESHPGNQFKPCWLH